MIPRHIQESIQTWFNKDSRATWYERIVLQEEAAALHENDPFSIRYAHVLEHILRQMTICMDGNERIVGRVKEIIPSEEQRAYTESLSHIWWDGVTEEEKQKRISFYYSPGWIKRRNPKFFSLGHLAFDWQQIIDKGLGWYIEIAEDMLASGKFSEDKQKQQFLEGAVTAYRAHSMFIRRCGMKAEELSQKAETESAQNRLRKTTDICSRICTSPAETFHEALQLVWFIILIAQKVCGCGVLCLSRMDQYLFSRYSRDIAEGVLTEDEALELIIEFYCRNNEIMFPTDHMSQEVSSTSTNLEVTYDDPNYLTVGGLVRKGISGVNSLSSLFIRAAHEMCLKNPFIVVRWHHDIDKAFWSEVCSAMKDNATVVVYNDQTMIPALMEYGVEEEDAYEYGFYGCNDPLIPAKEGGLRQLWFNLVWPAELALNGGEPISFPDAQSEDNFCLKDRLIGLMTGHYAGTESDLYPRTMEEFISMYRTQMQFLLNQYMELMEQDYHVEKLHNAGRIRIEDLFLQGTIDHAETWITGGTAYHKITMQGSGLASAVDVLAAVDQALFIDQRYTLDEIRKALKENFSRNREMHTYLSRLPKFGNDLDEADKYAAIVADAFCDAVKQLNSERKGLYTYMPAISTDRDFTGMGTYISALPDGRMKGDPISENQSPSTGADKDGVTALLNSVSKIPFHRITGGPLNLTLHPSSIEGEQGLRNLVSLMSVYMKRGGMQIQLNVVGKEQLLDAQENPDQYKNLCVRVTGYAAYFVQMGKTAQDEIIERTEKAL